MPPSKKIEVIARGVLMHQDSVLLCSSKKRGYSYLPGGHVDPGEASESACQREFLEETGLVVNAGRCLLVNELIFTQNGKPRHEITTVFHVELAAAENNLTTDPPLVQSREDHIEFRWVPLASVVGLDVRPACIRAWLASGGVVTGTPAAGIAATEWLSLKES